MIKGLTARHDWLLIGVLVLSVGSRFMYLHYSGLLFQPEPWEYQQEADSLLAGQGPLVVHDSAQYLAFGTSEIYPFVVAAVYALSAHSGLALTIVHVLLSTVMVWLVLDLGRWMAGFTAGLVAGTLAALHGPSIVYTGKVESLVVDALLATACVYATLMFDRRRDWSSGAMFGVTFGLAILSRPTLLVFLPLALLWLLARFRMAVARQLVLAAAIALAVVGTWAVRDYIVLGEPILVSTMAGENLWLGNNPHATGGALTPDGRVVVQLAPADFRREVMAAGEIERYHLYQSAALTYIRADPAAFVKRSLEKFLYFWWFSPQTGLRYPQGWLPTYQAVYGLYLGFAFLGMASFLARGTPDERAMALLLIALLLATSAAQSVFYVEGRHRWLVEPLLLIFTARGLLSLRFLSTWFPLSRAVHPASL